MYTQIFGPALPPLLLKLAQTKAMERLKDIGMHCGCEYADFPIYAKARGAYSRYTHSLGTAKIIWHFTRDIKQAAAGLLHDIASPVFAHTVDFMNGDHVNQESTENMTAALIKASPEIMELLDEEGLNISQVEDYHLYPIADNDTPMLSADRLEYTLGNAYLVHGVELDILKDIFKSLTVVKNSLDTDELCFTSIEAAKLFTRLSLKNSIWFISDEDRFAMQYLADLLRLAMEESIISPQDLYSTESSLIKKLMGCESTKILWENYRRIQRVDSSKEKPQNLYSVKIAAKKRYIDPLVLTKNGPKRITHIDLSLEKEVHGLLSMDFGNWIYHADSIAANFPI